MAAGYFTYTRSALWLLVAFLALLAFAAINDQWIGYVRRDAARAARAAVRACCRANAGGGSGGAAGAPRDARAARAAGPGRHLTAAPRPPPSPPQAVFIGLLVILLIVDAMFGNDADFIFDPSIKNYERTQARRAE